MKHHLHKIVKRAIAVLLLIIVALVVPLTVFLLSDSLGRGVVVIRGYSMDDTIQNNQICFTEPVVCERDSIVVVNVSGKRLIKRIVGLPLEAIEVNENGLYIDGELYSSEIEYNEDYEYNTTTLQEGQYYIVGDNSKYSLDSRKLGPVEEYRMLFSVTGSPNEHTRDVLIKYAGIFLACIIINFSSYGFVLYKLKNRKTGKD